MVVRGNTYSSDCRRWWRWRWWVEEEVGQQLVGVGGNGGVGSFVSSFLVVPNGTTGDDKVQQDILVWWRWRRCGWL